MKKQYWFGQSTPHIESLAVEKLLGDSLENAETALLCIGSVNYLNGIKKTSADDILLLVELPKIETETPVNTVVISFEATQPVQYTFVYVNGVEIASGSLPLNQLFVNMRIHSDLETQLMSGNAFVGCDLEEFVPLFYVSYESYQANQDVFYKNLFIYSQIRFCIEDGLFIRTSPTPYFYAEASSDSFVNHLGPAAEKALGWLDEALRLHELNPVFLNNHQCYYQKCFAGKELENKFTLAPPVNGWGLTVDLYQKLRRGELKGYIMEYRDEYQQWDYINNLFEIPGPPEEQGYISFIPATDGKVIVKRKHYCQDQFMRGEIQYKTKIDVPYEQFIKETYGVNPVKLPPFRRVRYDVNFESTCSGHVYGIFFDHCSIVGAETITLNQCEVEYLRSRTVLAPDEAKVLEEIEAITAWVRDFLKQKGIEYHEGYYSKLSFLREHVGDGVGQSAISLEEVL